VQTPNHEGDALLTTKAATAVVVVDQSVASYDSEGPKRCCGLIKDDDTKLTICCKAFWLLPTLPFVIVYQIFKEILYPVFKKFLSCLADVCKEVTQCLRELCNFILESIKWIIHAVCACLRKIFCVCKPCYKCLIALVNKCFVRIVQLIKVKVPNHSESLRLLP
jgi:hypothetical protein